MKIKLLIFFLTLFSFSNIISARSEMTSIQNDRAIDLFKETNEQAITIDNVFKNITLLYNKNERN